MDKYDHARDALLRNIGVFEGAYLDKKEAKAAARDIKAAARRFHSLRGTALLLDAGVKKYFADQRKNKREIKRFLKKSRKRLLRKEKGKFASYEITRAAITDLRRSRGELSAILRDAAIRITQ